MTRDDLKELIRECLIEILSEGAPPPRRAPAPAPRLRESAAARAAIADAPRRKTIGGMSLDRPAIPEAVAHRARVQQVATSAASKITSDPVLSAIFADTAATTLQEQASAEKMRPGTAADPVSLAVANREVDELFGDAAQNWAALAFSDSQQR